MAAARVSRCGLCLLLAAVLCAVHYAGAVEIYAPNELFAENGTYVKLPCTFKSTEVTGSTTSVTWMFTEEGASTAGVVIFYYINGKKYPGQEPRFKDRVTWVGDINNRDVSIKLDKITFKDNGTYSCNVLNPPDIMSTPKQIKLRVVEKDNLPASNVPFLVGIICAVIGGILVIAIIVFAVVIIKKEEGLERNYTGSGCGDGGQTESLMSPVKQPPSRSPSGTEALVTGAPSGTMQGPVIYAQLDHSGKPGSQINKSETVVYADIRKNC
ncbi:LOW QUALITY PROTEIN: myelin protein zero-like protein 1 [Hyla sarda]|uniref:LOW QUALITY PROTEIN: myelin protein zero-like protein 1 n=1 Tax=Hyla sarda TaxID=327740 RepID=UPI0024C2568A|nr:LOW QUALITY PROTEIN: myelin protein zero-like protein 1 [Hyla sarda]